jgi:hypothetical protein
MEGRRNAVMGNFDFFLQKNIWGVFMSILEEKPFRGSVLSLFRCLYFVHIPTLQEDDTPVKDIIHRMNRGKSFMGSILEMEKQLTI